MKLNLLKRLLQKQANKTNFYILLIIETGTPENPFEKVLIGPKDTLGLASKEAYSSYATEFKIRHTIPLEISGTITNI